MNKTELLYCSDLGALKEMLKEDGYYDEESGSYNVNHTLTPLKHKDNTSLSYVMNCSLDLEKYTMLESLGDYPEMFADEAKHDLYKSVYPYDEAKTYLDEDGVEQSYMVSKYIGKFA